MIRQHLTCQLKKFNSNLNQIRCIWFKHRPDFNIFKIGPVISLSSVCSNIQLPVSTGFSMLKIIVTQQQIFLHTTIFGLCFEDSSRSFESITRKRVPRERYQQFWKYTSCQMHKKLHFST